MSTAQSDTKPTIVLIHGAFADGTSWQHVIPLLEQNGYSVLAVQIPLSSVPDDVATTKRAIDFVKGPVVLVGHSYGGVVITGAGAGAPNVKALVYIAAYAPEVNETIGATTAAYAATPLAGALTPDSGGYLYINRDKFHSSFCADVPDAEARIMAVVQKPLNASAFGATLDNVAWKTIPSWYLVSQDDKAINPDQERFYAKRMKATTREVKSSHVSMVSHPADVAKLIEDAVHGTIGAMAMA
jgi:pimeloyl-ACP methyl ester carboxylesterase